MRDAVAGVTRKLQGPTGGATRGVVLRARRVLRSAVRTALLAALLVQAGLAAGAPAARAAAAPDAPVRVGLLQPVTVPPGNPFHLLGASGATLWNDAAGAAWLISLAGPIGPRGDLLPVAASTLTLQRHMNTEPGPAPAGAYVTAVVPLRRDLSWSDGSRLDAEDVVFTYTALGRLSVERLGGNWPTLYPAGLLARVEALDAHTVKFWFHRLPGLGEWQYGLLAVPILHKETWEPHVEAALATPDPAAYIARVRPDPVVLLGPSLPDPSGPAGWSAAQNLRDVRLFERVVIFAAGGAAVSNPYTRFEFRPRGAGGEVAASIQSPAVPPHTFRAVGSRREATELLAAGELDAWLDPLAPAPFADFTGMRLLGFNAGRTVTGQRAFRQAIAGALDREALARSLAPTYAVRPAYSLVPEAHASWHYAAPAGQVSAAERLAAARELLRTVRRAPDGPLVIAAPEAEYDPVAHAAATHVAAVLKELGIEAGLVAEPFAEFVERVFVRGDFDLFVAGWRLNSGAFPHQLTQLARPADGSGAAPLWSVTGYQSSEYQQLARQLVQATDTATARRVAERLQELLRQDAVLVPLLSLGEAGGAPASGTAAPGAAPDAAAGNPAPSADLAWLWSPLVPRHAFVWLE